MATIKYKNTATQAWSNVPLQAFSGSKVEIKTYVASLPVASWVKNTSEDVYEQSVEIDGITIDVNKTSVIVSPSTDRTMEEAYLDVAGRASGQGDGVLIFTCTDLPEIDLEANVMLFILG